MFGYMFSILGCRFYVQDTLLHVQYTRLCLVMFRILDYVFSILGYKFYV